VVVRVKGRVIVTISARFHVGGVLGRRQGKYGMSDVVVSDVGVTNYE